MMPLGPSAATPRSLARCISPALEDLPDRKSPGAVNYREDLDLVGRHVIHDAERALDQLAQARSGKLRNDAPGQREVAQAVDRRDELRGDETA
jgi:hypothetical protein